ncbi:hypothetical protein BH11ACT6_BH11ACT6_13920 [soil metagenome]
MIALRVVLGAIGLAVIAYGAVLLLDNPGPTLLRITIWAAAGVVLHDFVFAPLVTAFGYAGRRILPKAWWAPVGVAALVSVILLLLAIPVFDRPGAKPLNPTVVDRDYPQGLWISLALVWACAALYVGFRRVNRRSAAMSAPKSQLPVGEDEVVDQQRADHVDRQPPPV